MGNSRSKQFVWQERDRFLPQPSRRLSPRTIAFSLAFLIGLLIGCQGPALPRAPTLYSQNAQAAFADVPPARRTTEIEILYATDRSVEHTDDGEIAYGSRRSPSLAFGRAVVHLGREMTWDELVEASLNSRPRVPISVGRVEEIVRLPSTMTPLVRINHELVDDPAVVQSYLKSVEVVHAELARRMRETDRHDVFLFVHGVHNGFHAPLRRMAQLWHFLGRPGVPVVYTWPAKAKGGPLRGYMYDRESSEFTIAHCRQLLEILASSPEVERIHILAHSRGTDVVVTTLRELHLLRGGDPKTTRGDLKLGQLILAAPDIDWEVAQQRLRPDRVHLVPERLTIYATPEDKAIGLASWLFSSLRRLGQLTGEMLTEKQRQVMVAHDVPVDFIDVNVRKKGSFGHSYFIDNPSVFSDVILILRDERPPGAEHGRPLIKRDDGFWELRDGYPYLENDNGQEEPSET